MDPFEDNMNKAFRKLAADIIPSDEIFKEANLCADKVIKFLQAESKFKIGSVCIAGSSGKKTTIIGSDIDCVLFINGERPPFKDVLEDFEDILHMTDKFNIRDVQNVHKTRFSVQFKALEFDFDILPAANLIEGLQGGGDRLIDVQQERVLRIIGQDPNKYGYMYSSSLAFSTVRFMEQQDGFVNEMVRIAKFWYKTLYFSDEYNVAKGCSGAKNCIELIAVHAARQEMGTRSYLRSFNRFITYIQKFDGLNIDFGQNGYQYDRPRVMDPVNPYNNLANCWDLKSIQLLKQYANETHQRLQNLASSRIARLDILFEPQPVFRLDMREIFGFDPTKLQFLLGAIAYNSSKPDLKVRNERFHNDFKFKMFLDIIQKYFQFAIYTSKASGGGENEIKKATEHTISRQIYNTEKTWSTSEDKHESYDVTFTIPFDSSNAIRVSFKQ